MKLIEVITSKENLNKAYKKVVANKGASGVDGVTVEELGDYIRENKDKIIMSLRNRTYMPKPVRRVYIPKENGKKRPLGIPTALDRTIQQAIAQPISDIYEEIFSEFIISKDLLENRIKGGAGLLNPLSYYLSKVGI